MRVAFAGTPEFAASALQRLRDAGFEVPLVLTQPDRPAGRGLKLSPSPVKQLAHKHGITVLQPRSLRLDGRFAEDAQAARAALGAAKVHGLVVAAYGLILPQWVLDLMGQASSASSALGCINIHASLLPRWRGAAPIQRAIEAGDAQTGVTIMQMDAGLDTGDMLLARQVPIVHVAPLADTSGSLHDTLAKLGADLIVETLQALERGSLPARAQPAEGATYARKVDKAEAQLDWNAPAALLERRIRAFNPAPGAWTTLEDGVVKVWRAELADMSQRSEQPAGTILAVRPEAIDVACGRGTLRLRELQRAGGKRMLVDAFLHGSALRAGMRLGPSATAAS
ncbi:MAG: methionyl-tRNA formyltransferase [Burkholderiaceae bacterium]